MSSSSSSSSSASVRNILNLLTSRDAQLVAGVEGIERRATWACRMRARLPAFESMQGGEIALLTLALLRRLNETLPHLLLSLHQAGVAAVVVAAPTVDLLGEEAVSLADRLHLPLIWLPMSALLEEIEREVITFVVSFRGEMERKAAEITHQLMQLSVQGAGIQGVCEHLARSRGKWVIMQDAEQHIRFQAAPSPSDTLLLPSSLTDEALRHQGLTRVVEPILIRHEVVGYLSLIGNENDFDYAERIVLSQAVPILAMEFARQRERSEVESRYQVEAFTDVLQGHYQHADEMLARARLLGYDLSVPQVVVVFESVASDSDYGNEPLLLQWGRRVRDELLRVWSTCWLLSDAQRVVALLPLSVSENSADDGADEQTLLSRLERVYARIQQNRGNMTNLPSYSCGIGRIAAEVRAIPQSFREAQRALEIGRRLFGEGKIHSFAHLGVYRLLFYLDGQSELTNFHHEMLGPLLSSDTHNDGTWIETLEGFFRCNGNLSETARTMHMHRNTLLYRLSRIEEIIGHSLEDPELRLSLQIALKIHHLHTKN